MIDQIHLAEALLCLDCNFVTSGRDTWEVPGVNSVRSWRRIRAPHCSHCGSIAVLELAGVLNRTTKLADGIDRVEAECREELRAFGVTGRI